MQFSDILDAMRPDGSAVTVEVGADWGQGRATFGGLVAALGHHAMRAIVPAERALRSLQVSFLAPLPCGPVHIEAQILRAGRAVTLAQARVVASGAIAAVLTGAYGLARASALAIVPRGAAGVPPAAALPDTPVPPGAPLLLQHFALRWAQGHAPYSGADVSHSKVYVRHRDPAPLTEAHVIALIDCIPPPVLQRLTSYAPQSSLVWNMEFLGHDFAFAAEQWWRIDTETLAAADGYAHESSWIFDPNGTPFALSRQLVAVFG